MDEYGGPALDRDEYALDLRQASPPRLPPSLLYVSVDSKFPNSILK
jgi:hypothetical protein